MLIAPVQPALVLEATVLVAPVKVAPVLVAPVLVAPLLVAQVLVAPFNFHFPNFRVAKTCRPCRPVGANFPQLVLIFRQSMQTTVPLCPILVSFIPQHAEQLAL